MKVMTNQPCRVSKERVGMDYTFEPGKPIEVKEEHLKFLPGWGTPECAFKAVEQAEVPNKKHEKRSR